MKYLWRNKVALVVILLLVFYAQTAISLPEQSKTENVVTAIGVDKVEDEFEISLQYILPYKSGAENELKLSSIKGNDLSEALELMALHFGKHSGFAHCKMLILNDLACSENITSILDFFVKIKTNTNEMFIINTNKSAKDLLSSANSLNSDLYVVMNCNCYTSYHRQYQQIEKIGDYYDSYFGKTKCFVLTVMNVEEEPSSSSSSEGSSTGASSSDSSSSESSSSSTSSKQKKLKNDGILAILKDGKKILELDEQQSMNLSLFNKTIKDQFFTVEHFSDDLYNDAQITFDIYNKRVKIKTSFEGGVPHYTLDLKLNVRLSQITSNNITSDHYDISKMNISDKLKKALSDQVRERLMSAEANFKANKYDVVKCFSNLYKFQNKEFKQYLYSLAEGEYFLDNVVFDYNILVSQHP